MLGSQHMMPPWHVAFAWEGGMAHARIRVVLFDRRRGDGTNLESTGDRTITNARPGAQWRRIQRRKRAEESREITL